MPNEGAVETRTDIDALREEINEMAIPEFEEIEEEVTEVKEEVVEEEESEEESEESEGDAEESESGEEEEEETEDGEDDDEESEEEGGQTDTEDDFEFTPDADDETFDSEAAQYLETLEIPAPLQAILDKQKERVEAAQTAYTELNESVNSDEVKKVMSAVDKLVEFKEVDGRLAPDVEPLVEFLAEDYQNEFPQIAYTVLTRGSQKYPGKTQFQEVLMDGYGLDEKGLDNLQTYLTDGAAVAVPSYVPEGIDTRLQEAFWQQSGSKRAEIENLIKDINDPNIEPEDLLDAQTRLQDELRTLTNVQRGLNAEKQQQEFQAQQQQNARLVVEQAAEQAYANTTMALAESFADSLTKPLAEVGGAMTARGLVALAADALTDSITAPGAQESLKSQGIVFNWEEGRAKFDELKRAETNLATLEARRANGEPINAKGIQKVKEQRTAIVKELAMMERELLGRMTKTVVKAKNTEIETKIEKGEIVKKKTAVSRKKVKGKGTQNPTKTKVGRHDYQAHRDEVAKIVESYHKAVE